MELFKFLNKKKEDSIDLDKHDITREPDELTEVVELSDNDKKKLKSLVSSYSKQKKHYLRDIKLVRQHCKNLLGKFEPGEVVDDKDQIVTPEMVDTFTNDEVIDLFDTIIQKMVELSKPNEDNDLNDE